MYSPTTRVLTVLELLQAHGTLTGAELAARLQVDARTLRRYIARLEELGIPVTAERGRAGGYRLRPGFKLPPMMFTDEEAQALALGLVAARSLGLGEAAPAVQSAQAKLERVMPDALKRRVRALGSTVQIDLARPDAQADQAALMLLSTAAHERQRVQLAYRSAQSEATERAFDCYGLAWRAGRWYAVGWCHLRRDLRTFRLDRIARLAPCDAHFQAPPDFDAVRHLALGIATLPRGIHVEVLLKADLQRARAELFEAIGLFQPAVGGVLLHSQTDDLDWYARQLARLPFGFEVRTPHALHAAVRACARRLLAQVNARG